MKLARWVALVFLLVAVLSPVADAYPPWGTTGGSGGGGPPTGAAGGDLTGTYPNPNVQSISGAATVNLNSVTAFSVTGTGAANAAAASVQFNGQAVNATNGTAGNWVFNIPAPTGTGLEGDILFERAGTVVGGIGAISGTPGDEALWLGSTILTGNYVMTSNGATTFVNASSAVALNTGGATRWLVTSSELQPQTDNTYGVGDSSHRATNYSVAPASGFQVINTSGDANPIASLTSSLNLGAGGASAVDTRIARSVAHVAIVDNGFNGAAGLLVGGTSLGSTQSGWQVPSGSVDAQLGNFVCTPFFLKTTDTITHTFNIGLVSGHVTHFRIDWTCVATATPANADTGLVDYGCSDSLGTVTCAAAATGSSHVSLGTEGCNAPTVTAGGANTAVLNISASAAGNPAIDWQLMTCLNQN